MNRFYRTFDVNGKFVMDVLAKSEAEAVRIGHARNRAVFIAELKGN